MVLKLTFFSFNIVWNIDYLIQQAVCCRTKWNVQIGFDSITKDDHTVLDYAIPFADYTAKNTAELKKYINK